MSQITYILNPTNTMIAASDGRHIPVAPGNGDFSALIEELKLANLAVENNDGTFTFSPDGVVLFAPPQQSLDFVRSQAFDSIDSQAYVLRTKFVTPNMDATYIAKVLQIKDYVAANYPVDLTNYGYVTAEVARLGLNATALADRETAANGILTIYNAWTKLDAAIETARLVGKAAIKAATTLDAVTTALTTAQTQFAAILASADAGTANTVVNQ
ncbi:hypothetical protein [Ralstonia phage RP13]|nr:hypothetical protein [Ralstonia phage RP13]